MDTATALSRPVSDNVNFIAFDAMVANEANVDEVRAGLCVG
jgi:hypothetical protein